MESDDERPAASHPAGPPKYRDKRTARFAVGQRLKEFQAFRDQAERRLDYLETAVNKADLMKLPSNRFEALGGDREGQCSIRINKQWRVCVEWPDRLSQVREALAGIC